MSYVTTILNAMMGKQYKRSIKLSHQKLTVSEVRGSVKSTSIATNSSEFDSIRFDCGSSSTLRTKQKKKKNYNKSFDTKPTSRTDLFWTIRLLLLPTSFCLTDFIFFYFTSIDAISEIKQIVCHSNLSH